MRIQLLAVLSLLSLPSLARSDEPDNSFMLSLERTACYGTCPTYQVTLEPNHTVTFIGKGNVAALGEHTTSIDPEAAQQLLSKFDAAGFLELPPGVENECKSSIPDLPGIVLLYRKGEKTRTVSDVSGCSGNKKLDTVRELAREVDKALKTGQWVK